MIRREVREKAFMFLFQLELQKGDEEQQWNNFLMEYDIDENSSLYMQRLVDGVRLKKNELDAIFLPYLKGWTLERLPRVDRTILRLAVFEMLFVDEVPDRVAISEAVLLSKKYSSEESRSYINAVLGKVSRDETRSEEYKQDEISHHD